MREVAAASAFCMTAGAPPLKSALEDTPEQREKVYESKWNAGGSINFLYAYRNLLVDKAGNETAGDFVRAKIRSIVKDPKVAELLSPKGYYIGTKRLCLGTNYYETYNRDNVSLVDIRETPIERITKAGIMTTDAEYPFDLIVFATGFDAVTGPLFALSLTGVGGVTLKEAWKDGPQSYLGLMVSGFPNLFTVNGPSSPSALTNMLQAIEHHVDWIVDCIAFAETNGFAGVDADEEAQIAWAHEVANMADKTLYTKANSWYMGANVPGKPRVFLMYIGGLDNYVNRCDQIVQGGYIGFNFLAADQGLAEMGQKP